MDKVLSLETWNRKDVYRLFHDGNPFYTVSFQVDVTRLYGECKGTGLSFYLSMVYECTRALNSIENYRYTVRNGQLLLMEERRPSFTDLRPGEDVFHITNMALGESRESFARAAKAKSLQQQVFMDTADEGDDLVCFSCVPGLRMTGIVSSCAETTGDRNVISITWGQLIRTGDRAELILSMQVNHCFVDGIHISRFAAELEKRTAEREKTE